MSVLSFICLFFTFFDISCNGLCHRTTAGRNSVLSLTKCFCCDFLMNSFIAASRTEIKTMIKLAASKHCVGFVCILISAGQRVSEV